MCCFPAKQLSPVYRIGISPDMFEPWPHGLTQMLAWAFEPADESIVLAMIDKGRRDARAWAEQMELVEASARMDERAAAGEGQVAAAKAAAAGTRDAGEQERLQREGARELEQRQQQEAEAGRDVSTTTKAVMATGVAAAAAAVASAVGSSAP